MLTGLARKVEDGYNNYWKHIIENHDVDLYLHAWESKPDAITNNEDIKVELLSSDKAEYNKDDGMLIWKYEIGAKVTKKFSFSYSMKYHKDKQLAANY